MNEPQLHQSESATPTTSPALTAKQKLRAWLELSRISNLPTVWSNVLVGVAIATVAASDSTGTMFCFNPWDNPVGVAMDPWRMLRYSVVPIVAISMFYIAGMMLNDLLDFEIDKTERPNRPLPSGRISKKAANNVVCFQLVVGLFSLWLWSIFMASGTGSSWWAAVAPPALMASIIGYNYWHKRHPLSIILMGASRSLVYITAAFTLYWPMDHTHPVWIMAVVLGLYTIGITIIARGETEDRIDNRKWLAVAMPVVVVAMIALVRPVNSMWPAVAGIALCLWLAPTIRYVFIRPPKTIKAILTWLSGMCLVDAYFLTLLGQPILAAIAVGCFLLTAWGHRHILGT